MVNILLFPYDFALLKLIWLFSQSSSTNFLQISDFSRKERQTFMDHLYQSMQYNQKTEHSFEEIQYLNGLFFINHWRYNFTHHGVLESSYLPPITMSCRLSLLYIIHHLQVSLSNTQCQVRILYPAAYIDCDCILENIQYIFFFNGELKKITI